MKKSRLRRLLSLTLSYCHLYKIKTCPGESGGIDKSGKYIEQSGIPGLFGKAYEYDKSSIENRKQNVVYCGYLKKHWGHFLLEGVSRLWYVNRHDACVDKYVFLIDRDCNMCLNGNYAAFFQLLGIYDKIELINTPVKYSNVIIPDAGYRKNNYWSQDYIEIFEKIASAAESSSDKRSYPERIFLTRSAWKKAHNMEIGLDMLDNYFANNGYEVISPEKLPLAEMINLIRHAKVCACASGTPSHNMMFAKCETALQIIERFSLYNTYQADVDRMKQLNVTYIDGSVTIYPVCLSYGPFMFTYIGMLEKFSEENNMHPCDKKFRSNHYLKHCFQKYMRAYRKEHGFAMYCADWFWKHMDCEAEAYEDLPELFNDYLHLRKRFHFTQYFSVRFIRCMANMLKNYMKLILIRK